MNEILPFVVSGIAVGAVYGLAATGLVLTYKTSGIFNFGFGALATVAAYVFHWLNVDRGLDWKLSLFLSVFVLGPLLGLLMEQFARRLAPQPTALKIVGTIGLILVVQGLASIKYGATTVSVDQFLPGADGSFELAGVVITYDKVIITAVAVVSVAALYALFRWSRPGLAMRAVVDDPDLLAMQATDPTRVRRLAWVIGSTFAALSGVLITPLIGLDSILLTYTVVQAFAAAAIGSFSNIPLALAGGFVVGIAADVASKYSLGVTWLSGLPAAIPFLILFLVLLLRGRKLVAPTRAVLHPRQPYRAPGRLRLGAGGLILVPLLFVPSIAGDKLTFFTTGLATAVLLLSLGLLVRMSGQVSLCHAAFAAVGAVAFSQLAAGAHLPWILSLILAGLVAVPVGAIVAIPAIRLSGLFLALATFGFGILVQQLFYPQEFMFTHFSEGRAMPHPSFATSSESYYYVVLAALIVAAVAIVAIQRSRLGRMLRGMADSPTSVTAMGLNTSVARVTVFCISAFLAAEAGVLLGVERNFAIASDPFFGSFNSLLLLAMLALAPFAEPWYALVPAIAAVVPGYLTGANTTYWLNVLFGVSAILVSMSGGNPTMPARLRAWFDRLGRRRGSGQELATAAPATPVVERPIGSPGIEIRDLTIRFGGIVPVDGLSLLAPSGRITGLIGPNGAGKTSTFNACSGFNRRIKGRVLLHGDDVTGLPPAARARRGLGRTFQSVELCDTLTVLENVRLGDEAGRAGVNPLTQVLAGRQAWRATRENALAAVERCGVGELAETEARNLSTGQRRLVELARCLAAGFDFLLLDEPSAGLDPAETARFGDLLLEVAAETRIGILLIEHDMSLVMRLCEQIYVMDFGKLIFHGTPAEVAANPLVRSAYLGSDEVMAAVGGESGATAVQG